MQQIVKDTLIVGQTFKNWIVLCQTLKQIPKKGNSKKSQVKEFKKYFDWEQQGQKLTITEIYDTPKEKIDNRGKSVNSLKALEENRTPRTIPLDILLNGYSQIGQGTHGQIDILEKLGMWNIYTKYFIFNKDDILYNKDSPFKECDFKVIEIVINNLYNSSRSKSLCEYVKQEKMIIYYDENDNYCSRFATDEEMTIIKQVEQDVIKTYNERHDTTFDKFSDIYVYATKDQRMTITNMKRNKLENKLSDYNKDKSCLIVGNIENIDIGLDEEQTKKQINNLFYEHEKKRIITYYDKQIEEITTTDKRCYGNIKTHKIKQIEENKEYSLKLLEYVLKLDLTKEEHDIIQKMLGLKKDTFSRVI